MTIVHDCFMIEYCIYLEPKYCCYCGDVGVFVRGEGEVMYNLAMSLPTAYSNE